MSENIRIRTSPDGSDKYVNLKIEQKFDFIEVLSLKISQDKAYQKFSSDYGVIVGRAYINSGFGVKNAKVSVFIPISDEDKLNPEIANLYPYETISDVSDDGIRYNLLPKEKDNNNECYTPIGTFPQKREILDNDEILEVYQKYYKFTAVTNYAGDFMIFGVPLGQHTVHIDVDISDIGIASQRPYDLIDQGTPSKMFYSPTKFKDGKNINSLVQVKSINTSVNVNPFWGDTENYVIGINRVDFDLNYNIRPAAIFTGSLFGDSKKNSVNKNCSPRKKMGKVCEQITSEGTIDMIRKNLDGEIEEFNVNGGRVIDSSGVWAYQIPMNLDYVITDEYGTLIPSGDPNKGVPTRARVRFKIVMDDTGGTARLRTRGKHLVPHNPNSFNDLDFNFDKTTKDSSFTDLYWNKIYTVKNFIARTNRSGISAKSASYIGIKDVDGCVGNKTPFPYNRVMTHGNILFTLICIIFTIIATIVSVINSVICTLWNIPFIGRFFRGIGLVRLPCPATDKLYAVGSRCGDASRDEYMECVRISLADSLELFEFDFYNDWVNGSLYFYLLKYKKKKSGDKFCETNCKDYQGGTGVNDCHDNWVFDTTYQGNRDYWFSNFKNGLMVKYGDELFYPPIVLNGTNLRLYATDIVGLGPVFDCDWQGFPKIIDYIPDTTYRLPPLIGEDNEAGVSGLLLDIDCGGVRHNDRQAMNIRRQCELQVDVPEKVGDSLTINAISINEIYDTSDTNEVIYNDNRFIRDTFTLININGSMPSYPTINPLPDLTNPANGTSFGIGGNISVIDHNNGTLYNTFRDYQYSYGQPDLSVQAWGNSYYMYFGSIPGNSAIDRLNSKYFTKCVGAKTDDFIIETNVNLNGALEFTFIGGTPPFKYIITNNSTYNTTGETTLTGTINNLANGTYTIKAIDSLNTIMDKTITII